jgi:hypothetical protein
MIKATFQGTQFTETPFELRKQRACRVCDTPFTPRSGVHKHCSEACKGKWKYMNGKVTTGKQYESISGNWSKYFDRLLGKGRRGVISRNDLLKMIEDQNYRCALSGLELTCTLEQGKKFKTNASIDRLDAGGSYAPENVQLVCAALNGFRIDTTVDEFIWYCQQVAAHQSQKGKV